MEKADNPRIIQSNRKENTIEGTENNTIKASPYSHNAIIPNQTITNMNNLTSGDVEHSITNDDLTLNSQLIEFLNDIKNPEKFLVTPSQFTDDNNPPLRKKSTKKEATEENISDNYPMYVLISN